MTKPTKVAIYARVSTADQNPEAQLLALREYAARRGFEVFREYLDYVSGSAEKRTARRKIADKAYWELMDDVSRRAVDCVIVWKYDRFARSLSVLVSALQQFHALGVDFISYTQNIDTTTPMGRLFYHTIGSFAEFEREIIVERVRAGLANARIGRLEFGVALKKDIHRLDGPLLAWGQGFLQGRTIGSNNHHFNRLAVNDLLTHDADLKVKALVLL